MRLVGLYREAECSPGQHRSNDALLLERVAGTLRAHKLTVELLTIDQASARRRDAALLFSMCQGRRALERLSEWEAEGISIVNSPRSALKTYRERLPGLMQSAGIPFPVTTLMPTDPASAETVTVNGGLWLKRGDVHASVAADVQWVDSAERLREGLEDFASRGIAQAAVQAHHEGDEVKFYGVAGGRFFHWFYPADRPARYPLDPAALERLATCAAAAAGLDIFGGDVIVSPAGELTLIDLNDWPSFAPCREPAAEAIAGYLMGHIDVAWNANLVTSTNENAV